MAVEENFKENIATDHLTDLDGQNDSLDLPESLDEIKKRTIFVCKDHGTQFGLTRGRFSVFYRCPKYLSENREEKESVCNNRMTIYEADEICQKIYSLKNHKQLKEGITWTHKMADMEIMEINPFYIKVAVKNRYKGGKGWKQWD